MMLDTADNKIYFPRFYDIDTICSYDNSGQLKFDVDIEMEQGYWNTSSSRLWTRIRDLMHNDIVTTYNNMRQNGVSYENMMKYIYDEQIAKIPQTYYNKDYDVKYAPFADSYIGMAHGDTYEHVKRWLKQRFTFVDTLFDYAPSYNNDVLTIRANTTELMTLEIETYTPVYQHVSWYNGQMDKKKIDGKVSVEFSGTAQAATDQEVLIYGGSNVKSIKGITSMNPNRMLIGSATKLVEIDAHDCPLLADINANKANLSPHEYLNKVNLSNCPLLEGNLRLNNSPLVQEINIKGTNITGMNLPSSIRNLQVLRLPNTMTELTLNDASMLHTLDFDEGVNLQSVSMTNCNALENVTGLDLLQTPSIVLNNSYNNVAELYFRDTTNLSLSNMSNLERVIFTPNNEYEIFELINVANAPDYKVTTFNCPKLSTFMTTAPYRESYNNVSGYVDKEVEAFNDTILVENYKPQGATFEYNLSEYNSEDTHIFASIDISECMDINHGENILSIGRILTDWVDDATAHFYYIKSSNALRIDLNSGVFKTIGNVSNPINIELNKNGLFINDERIPNSGGSYVDNILQLTSLNIGSCEGANRSNATYNYIKTSVKGMATIQVKDYGDIQPNTTFTANSIDISNTQFTDVKLLCTTDTNALKLPTSVKNFYCDSSFDLDTNYLEDGEYDVVHGELVEPYTTDYEGEVVLKNVIIDELNETDPRWIQSEIDGNGAPMSGNEIEFITDFISVTPSTTFKIQARGTLYRCRLYEYDIDKTYIGLASSQGVNEADKSYTFTLSKNTRYVRPNCQRATSNSRGYKFIYKELRTPNLVPSSADGSLIFSMYAPSNTVAPANGIWDLKGLEFNNFHTFGMNNDVRGEYEVQNIPNFEGIIFTSDCFKGTRNTSTYAGYFQMGWLNLNKATVITSDGSKIGVYIPGLMYNDKSPMTITEPCVALSFYPTVEWVKIIENGTEYHFEKSSLELGTKNVSLDDETGITLSVSSIVTGNLQSITMPARYDDYNITIKNANISPKTHNTMLYPLLVNEDNPITGTLDYTNYAGKHLSWSFAYTDEEYVNIIQPKDELINSYEYKYNAFYQTEYEFDNPYEVAKYTSSASGVLPSFNAEFTYTYDEIDNGDGTYTTKIYADSLDNLPTRYVFKNLHVTEVLKLNMSAVTNMSEMFAYSHVTKVNLPSIGNNVKVFDRAFQGCYYLTEIKGIKNWNTSEATSMSYMFYASNSLTSLDLSGFDTGKVTKMQYMFDGCTGLTSLNLSGFDTSSVTNMVNMFSNCNKLTSLNLSEFDTSNVTDMSNMFANCKALTSLDVSGFDTKNVIYMNGMFRSCSGLTSLDLSGFDTKNVTTMQNMFYGCNKLTSLDLSWFDTSKVTSMGGMFYNCSGLTSLDLSGFDTNKVTNMGSMFYNCSSLTSLDLSNFDTINVINMNHMFNGCINLTSLNVSRFNTSKVTDMTNMFQNCRGLTSLDLSGFETREVTTMTGMFNGCSGLTSLDSMQNISVALSLSSTKLDAISLLDVINNLATVTTTQTLTLGATLLAKLTEDQIAIAVNKGWTVS